jgi:tRNA(Ser,Leu) C12 N-acetylase TAN1
VPGTVRGGGRVRIVEALAAGIDRKVDLDHPDRIVRIDVVGPRTAISVLRPDEVFSTGRPRLG